ncbi:GFA family protein [Salinisphaera sp. Q1T1-3]|uniref:GFA family protein n=1 Tax=Salinisphaera sp. Q1T1-3 TaxID=2321229 RepID=UPI000E7295B4|nr:GFA family protein [Salinisphaera sp. Q1T1-3]RJS91046.1 GFA family protein [Salinisphaera sp. Q1T1-3]
MDPDTDVLDGACHCGGVQFHVRLADGLRTARRCDCSYCSMRGAVAVSAALADIQIVAGADVLSCYTFGTHAAKHYFCSRCGIYTHHQRRSNPEQYGVNVACLDGMSPFDFAEVPVNNGRQHPSEVDAGAYRRVIGMLQFVPATD